MLLRKLCTHLTLHQPSGDTTPDIITDHRAYAAQSPNVSTDALFRITRSFTGIPFGQYLNYFFVKSMLFWYNKSALGKTSF